MGGHRNRNLSLCICLTAIAYNSSCRITALYLNSYSCICNRSICIRPLGTFDRSCNSGFVSAASGQRAAAYGGEGESCGCDGGGLRIIGYCHSTCSRYRCAGDRSSNSCLSCCYTRDNTCGRIYSCIRCISCAISNCTSSICWRFFKISRNVYCASFFNSRSVRLK